MFLMHVKWIKFAFSSVANLTRNIICFVLSSALMVHVFLIGSEVPRNACR